MTKLLIFAGSARKESLNKKLAALAAKTAEDLGAASTLIDLKDFEMPIYDGDLEADGGYPENAKRLKQLFVEHDGFFIASPEYNSSISPLLKNTLDWVSRPHSNDEPMLWAYDGNVAALGSVAPGAMGGMRGLVPLRMMLGNIGVNVVPNQVAIPNGMAVFDEAGDLKDQTHLPRVEAAIRQLVSVSRALAASRTH